MGNTPVLKPREVVRILERMGLTEARQRGSHKQFKHPDGRHDRYRASRKRYFSVPAEKDCGRYSFDGRRVINV